MAGFEGKWKMESQENFDDYLKAIGVGMMMRKMAGSSKPTLYISKAGEKWTIKTEAAKTTEMSFVLGVEFNEETADGRKCKSTISAEGPNKWVHVQKCEYPSTITREIVDANTMHITLAAKETTAKRIYKRA